MSQLDATCEGEQEVVLDARAVRALEPLAAVRIAMFLDEQRAAGRTVKTTEPEDRAARARGDPSLHAPGSAGRRGFRYIGPAG